MEFSIIEMILDCDKEMMEQEPDESAVSPLKGLITRHQSVEVTSEYTPHVEMQKVIDGYWVDLKKSLQKVAGVIGVDLESRFDYIR